jgi:hypothetical protein
MPSELPNQYRDAEQRSMDIVRSIISMLVNIPDVLDGWVDAEIMAARSKRDGYVNVDLPGDMPDWVLRRAKHNVDRFQVGCIVKITGDSRYLLSLFVGKYGMITECHDGQATIQLEGSGEIAHDILYSDLEIVRGTPYCEG